MKTCAVCRREYADDDPAVQRQFGGVGTWFACLPCILLEDQRREQKGQRFEKPLSQGRQRIPEEVLNLWSEESDEDTR